MYGHSKCAALLISSLLWSLPRARAEHVSRAAKHLYLPPSSSASSFYFIICSASPVWLHTFIVSRHSHRDIFDTGIRPISSTHVHLFPCCTGSAVMGSITARQISVDELKQSSHGHSDLLCDRRCPDITPPPGYNPPSPRDRQQADRLLVATIRRVDERDLTIQKFIHDSAFVDMGATSRGGGRLLPFPTSVYLTVCLLIFNHSFNYLCFISTNYSWF